jgi:hypothetical protein
MKWLDDPAIFFTVFIGCAGTGAVIILALIRYS